MFKPDLFRLFLLFATDKKTRPVIKYLIIRQSVKISDSFSEAFDIADKYSI